MNKKKRALVLAGGGAKGAYAFGCMQAFKQAGIEFEAVSGTSVGALNALLWSTDAMKEGEDLWRNLSYESVYPVRILNPKYWPALIIKVASLLYVLLRLIWSAVGGTNMREMRKVRLAIGIVGAMIPILYCLICYLALPEKALMKPVLAVLYSFMIGLPALYLFSLNTLHYNLFSLMALNALVVLCVLDLLHSYHIGFWIQWPVADFILLWLCLIAIELIFYFTLTTTIFSEKSSVLANSALRLKIQNIVGKHNLKIPTWVTVAFEHPIFDPENPKWTTDIYSDRGIIPPDALWEPDTKKKWIPHYKRIDAEEEAVVTNYCLASAALPFGMVCPVKADGRTYVDGGIIDNCPILPILDLEGVDEIFVVGLSTVPLDSDLFIEYKATVSDWEHRSKLVQLGDYPLPKPFRHTEPRTPLEKLKKYSIEKELPKIIFFSPQVSLGGWLSGTLNFSGKYAEKIMCQGKVDTLKTLESFGFCVEIPMVQKG